MKSVSNEIREEIKIMSTATTIIIIAIICLYLALNIATANIFTAKEMHKRFIHGQCIVGRIVANIFYAPAWLLKGVKFLAVKYIG